MTSVPSGDSMTPNSSDWLGLTGAGVLVAGAGGIGAACAAGFAAAGAKVVVVDRDQARLDALAAQVPGLQTHAIDLTEEGAGEAAVARAEELVGDLDVALHCVGINDRRPVLEFTQQEWERVLRVNLGTMFSLCQAAGRVMVGRGRGRVIALSSVSGLLAHDKHGPYATSKGGANQMVRVMAREWASSGVTVNAVAPGYIETDLTADHLAKPGVRESLTALVPGGRLGRPEEVVGPVLFLSSAQASFVTGHVLYVDGGRTLV